MQTYLLAHDLGTSGNKVTLFTTEGKLVASVTYPYKVKWRHTLWAEQDSADWYKAVCVTTKEILKEAVDGQVVGVSFSGQMMGCLCVDKAGNPLMDSIIWADMRGEKEVAFIKQQIDEKRFYQITGHKNSASNSLAKFLWVKNNQPEIYHKTYKMLNAKDYIILKLTGEFVTDYSDASGTNLLDLTALKWSEEIASAVGIDLNKMPLLKKSTDVVGAITASAAKVTGLKEGTPIICGGGDGAMAAVGAGCITNGKAFSSLGTSAWNAITTEKPFYDEKMRTFNFAHVVPNKYVPCGTMQTAGAAITWVIDQLAQKESLLAKETGASIYEIIEEMVLATQVGAKGLLFLPYLQGERSPWWNSQAKGSFIGLQMTTQHKELFRSVYEGIAMNLGLILDIIGKEQALDYIILTGGGGQSLAWCQIFADVYNLPIHIPSNKEVATSVGAAVTAGVGLGIYEDFKWVDKFIQIERIISPNPENVVRYKQLRKVFSDAYQALEPTYRHLDRFVKNGIGDI